MSEFKKGDRVRVIKRHRGDDAEVGQIGTVLEDGAAPWVVFDTQTNYGGKPEGWTPNGWRAGHMDCLTSESMEVITPAAKKTNPDRAALVELSGRVLVALAGSDCREIVGPEGAARWAVDAARVLLMECTE